MIKREKEDFTKGLSLGQKMAYYALYSVTYALSLLPMCALYCLSSLIYLVFYKCIGYRVKVTRKNLASSFPDKSAQELKDIEHKFYHFLCDYIVETIKLLSISQEEIKRRMIFHNIENITNKTNQGKSVILYMGHYAGWEWVTSLGLHIPGDVGVGQIYHILENPAFNALILKIRSKMGHESISMNMTLRAIINYQRKGIPVVLGFLSDQVPIFQATYHSMTFLNHPGTLVITGTERIAKQRDMGAVYMDIYRPKRGYYEVDIVDMGDSFKDVPNWQVTEQYFALLEKSIRRSPELWVWSHNRWKRTKEDWDRWKEEQQQKKE